MKGTLVVEKTGQPYVAMLYLGRAISASQPGYGAMISLSEQADPRATQDPATGAFEFRDVGPGTYAPVIWTPVGNRVVQKPGSTDFLLVEVQAGETSDLGTIHIP